MPHYPNGVAEVINQVREALTGEYAIDRAALATLTLQGDPGATARVRATEADGGVLVDFEA